MKIVPTPAPDEIAAILAALATAAAPAPDDREKPKLSRWRMAGRDYSGGAWR